MGLSGGSQETVTDPGPETTALIERGGPGTDRGGDEEVGDDDDEKGDHDADGDIFSDI